MANPFVLPLFPLDDAVLLPGAHFRIRRSTSWQSTILATAQGYGNTVATSLVDGESVHEVGVTALVEETEGETELHGLSRCRLLDLVREDVPLVRVERYPEQPRAGANRQQSLARLLRAHYRQLCARLGLESTISRGEPALAELTWKLTAGLGMPAEQQQGFLNVPDALTRGRLLLAALRELEGRERFLRPWAHLRSPDGWN